jgi:hypothetical protein
MGLLALLAVSPALSQDKGGPAATLDVVKYEGLKDAVIRSRGKVVLVDVWALF